MWKTMKSLVTRVVDRIVTSITKQSHIAKMFLLELEWKRKYEALTELHQKLAEEYTKVTYERDHLSEMAKDFDARLNLVQGNNASELCDLKLQLDMLRQSNHELIEMDQYLQESIVSQMNLPKTMTRSQGRECGTSLEELPKTADLGVQDKKL